MWVYFKGGFMVSIVTATSWKRNRERPRVDGRGEPLLQVRGRRREDVRRFTADLCGESVKIRETPKADYRFRAVLPADKVSVGMARAVLEVDYPNFKATIEEVPRKQVASSVWTATLKLDERPAHPLFSLPGTRMLFDREWDEDEETHRFPIFPDRS